MILCAFFLPPSSAFSRSFYFLPFAIAFNKKSANSGAIFALNVFLGWSLIGWVVALISTQLQSPSLRDIRVKTHIFQLFSHFKPKLGISTLI
ncbi:superinfection immunity protein [Polynucleobacter necessarius]|uniref:superinfection immunity protein n=1 Tax=Polynucleobacter necessarius TaxID=576610 RepID=UPI0039E2ABC1